MTVTFPEDANTLPSIPSVISHTLSAAELPVDLFALIRHTQPSHAAITLFDNSPMCSIDAKPCRTEARANLSKIEDTNYCPRAGSLWPCHNSTVIERLRQPDDPYCKGCEKAMAAAKEEEKKKKPMK